METETENPIPLIKHIIIAGGGTVGYKSYGILRESEKAGLWRLENIQTIYGTSIGGMMAVMIALHFDWDVLDDFIIKRPWHHVFKFDMNTIFQSFYKKGILDIHVVEQFYEPLFKAKDLDMKITMKEFYEKTGIDVHLFATEFNDMTSVDISWKTHPDWTVIESIYCSCCLPFLFSPYFKDDKIYYDGGVFCNYPLEQCVLNETLSTPKSSSEFIQTITPPLLRNASASPPKEGRRAFGESPLFSKNPPSILEEILGIKTNIKNDPPLDENSNLFDYITHLMKKFIHSSNEKIKREKIHLQNEIVIDSINVSLYDIYLAVSNQDVRIQLIEEGSHIWKEFSEGLREPSVS